jgi:hypothetical protein
MKWRNESSVKMAKKIMAESGGTARWRGAIASCGRKKEYRRRKYVSKMK